MVSPLVVGPLAEIAAAAPRPAQTDGLVPGDAELRAALTNDPAGWDTFIRAYITREILPHWQNAAVSPWIPKLIRSPSDLTGFVKKPAVALPARSKNNRKLSPTVDVLEYKLRVTKETKRAAPDDDIVRGHAVVQHFTTSGTLPSIGSLNDAVTMVRELRSFEGLLIRIAAAQMASSATGRPLSVVLALYRTEGDLVAPSSHASLVDAIPPIERWFDFNLDAPPIPNLSTGVWLLNIRPFNQSIGARPNALVDPDLAKLLALVHWIIVIAGYDYLSTRMVGSVAEVRRTFKKESAKMWASATPGASDPEAAADARFQELMDNLNVTALPATHPVLVVTPTDPAKLVGMILTEALMFMYAKHRDDAGDMAYMREGWRYLHYHAQRHYSHAVGEVAKDELRKILVSALWSARKPGNTEHPALRQQLAAVTFPPRLKYQVIWDAVKNAQWGEPEMALWESFVTTAGQSVWDDWFEHRANVSRYNVLLDYYQHLTA